MAAAPLRVWRERDGRLLRVRLLRPKANVLDAEMVAALDAAFAEVARPTPGEPALRAVLLDAEVTGIRHVALPDLTDEDAAAENFEDAAALKGALRYHYPGLPESARVAVVSFELT